MTQDERRNSVFFAIEDTLSVIRGHLQWDVKSNTNAGGSDYQRIVYIYEGRSILFHTVWKVLPLVSKVTRTRSSILG